MTKVFWKIFFWLLFLNLSLALLFFFFSGEKLSLYTNSVSVENFRKIQTQRIDAVTYLIKYGGSDAAYQYLSNTPAIVPRVWVVDNNGVDLLNRTIPTYIKNTEKTFKRTAVSPNGVKYIVFGYMPEKSDLESKFEDKHPRLIRLAFYFTGGFLACFWLAWHLTKPIKLLSDGVKKLSKGTLKEDVLPKLGNRNDEFVSLARDFDEMAKELQKRQQTLKQLLNDVSHELRSPLTRIRLSLGILEQQKVLTSKNLEKVTTELNRLDELIEQVLTVAQLDAKWSYPLDDYIELRGLLSNIIDQIDIEINQQNCQIKLVENKQLNELIMKGNKELLLRAFENILRNALKFSPKQSIVLIEILKWNNDVCIKITDQGPGVPDDKLQDLFTPFFRAEASRNSNGYGLGLTICQRAIEHNNGKVKAKNTSTGLSIEVTFPNNLFEETSNNTLEYS